MSLIKEAIILELKDYAAKALELKSKMDKAKTEVKRDLYFKKLKKNNTEAAELFEALNILMEREAKAAVDGVKDEVLVLEGRAEETDGTPQTVE